MLASGAVHRLTEQYRMHADIAAVVSGLFYHSLLETPPEVASEREAMQMGNAALCWVDVAGGESTPERSKSLQNEYEAEVVCAVASTLRARHADASIAVLTFYKGQLLELMRKLAAALRIEVLTVDACQGSEFEFVVLSTVRSNHTGESNCFSAFHFLLAFAVSLTRQASLVTSRTGKLGFVKDKQRVCVAISRAMRQLVIVGCADTLASDAAWRTVNSRAEPQVAERWEREGRAAAAKLAAQGPSVLEALAQGKADAREAAAQQAQQLMEQQPSFRASGQRAGAGQHGARPQQQRTKRGGRSSTDWVAETQAQLAPLDDDESFPTLGRAPARASHLTTTGSTSAGVPEAAAAPAGWDVSQQMLDEMFGARRVASVLAMLGGDLQRAFVVLLETDGQDDAETGAVDDSEWDYETLRPDEDMGEPADSGWEAIDASDPDEQPRMSVAAAPFVPKERACAESTKEQARQNARERALRILSRKDPTADSAHDGGGEARGAESHTWWTDGVADGDSEEADPSPATESATIEPAAEGIEEELRVDPTDGLLYCKADFLMEYDGTAEWEAAMPGKPVADAADGAEEEEDEQHDEVCDQYDKGDEDEEDLGPEPEPEPLRQQPVEVAQRTAAQRQLEEMGFEPEAARLALQAHESTDAAAMFLLAGGQDQQDQRADASEGPGAAVAAETLDAYVAEHLGAMGVDEDLCEYFVGMLSTLSEADDVEEEVEEIVELLVGYSAPEDAARRFVIEAPTGREPAAAAEAKRETPRRGGNGGVGAVRRVAPLRGAANMDLGVGVVDWHDPANDPWAT